MTDKKVLKREIDRLEAKILNQAIKTIDGLLERDRFEDALKSYNIFAEDLGIAPLELLARIDRIDPALAGEIDHLIDISQ